MARGLKRSLGPGGVLLLTLSALSPSSSVFVAGAGVLHMAGSGAAIAFIAGGLISALLALLYAEMGAAFPRAGGPYASVAGALGPGAAFVLAPLTALLAPTTTAFIALGLGDYLHVLAPAAPLLPLTLGGLVLAVIIASFNIEAAAWITSLFLAVEATALVILTALSLSHPLRPLGEVLAHPQVLTGAALAPASFATLALATVSGAWTTAGASWAMYFAEEMEGAGRIGRVISWAGLMAAAVIALPMVLVVLAVPDLKAMLAAEAPLAAFVGQTAPGWVETAVSLGVAAAIFNSLIAIAMAYSRFLYASGRDGVWPARINRALSALHPRLGSPYVAAAILLAVSAACVFLGERALLVLISGDVFTGALIAVGVLVGRRAALTGQGFRAPWHPLVPLFGLGAALLFILADLMDPDAGRPSILILSGVIALAGAYYALRLRHRPGGWVVRGAEAE